MACLLKLFARPKDNSVTSTGAHAAPAEAIVAQPQRDAEEEEDEDDEDVYQTMDNVPVLVQKGIFIGSFFAEQNEEALKTAGITHILQVSANHTPTCRVSRCTD
jgi:hypothetical protein